MRNPFQPYPQGKGPLKLLVYGDPGTEKTRRALSMPGPVYMIDCEAGGVSYSEALNGSGFYLSTKNHVEVIEAVRFCVEHARRNPGSVGTLIVDPIGVVWSSMQSAYVHKQVSRKNLAPEDVSFNVGVWGKLKRVYGDLLSTLLSAPFNVVMTARGKDKIDDRGNLLGYGPEVEKTTPYLVSVVIESRDGYDIVRKDRTGTYNSGHVVKGARIAYTDFLDNTGDEEVTVATESEAAEAATRDEDLAEFRVALERTGVPWENVLLYCKDKSLKPPAEMDRQERINLYNALKGA